MDDILEVLLRNREMPTTMDALEEGSYKTFKEVKKVLRDIKAATPLDWDNPSAQEVFDNILIGNRLAAQSIDFLIENKVSHLLNCAAPGPHNFMSVSPDLGQMSKHDISYLGLQLSDDSEEDISLKFLETGEWMEKALGDGGRQDLAV